MASSVAELSKTEWMAVAVALNDANAFGCSIPPEAGSLRDKLSGAARTLFGIEQRKQLADPRLETLRRFVCTTRARRRPADEFMPALLQHGFNPAQVDAIAQLSA